VRHPRIAVYGDGQSELGRRVGWGQTCSEPDLPALPRLVSRLTHAPAQTQYVPRLFKPEKHTHRGPDLSRMAKKAIRTMRQATKEQCAAVVILVDRDEAGLARVRELRTGRDSVPAEYNLPCAVGEAVHTFDAWMIADAQAVEAAGGSLGGIPLDQPEALLPERAKQLAKQALGHLGSMTDAFARVAQRVDLKGLAQRCPRGFAPFAGEVRERIRPIFDED